jgi:hypothetical protein
MVIRFARILYPQKRKNQKSKDFSVEKETCQSPAKGTGIRLVRWKPAKQTVVHQKKTPSV